MSGISWFGFSSDINYNVSKTHSFFKLIKVGLITSHSFMKPGGVKRHVLGLHGEFRRRGIESKIIVPRRKRKEKCKRWTRKKKLTNVVFEGETDESKAPSYYASCDIYCSPAIYGESFGIVLIEAMATGKPVVAFVNKGHKGVLEKGKGKRFFNKEQGL